MTFEPAYYMDLPAAERAALNDFCCDQTHDLIPVYSGYLTLPDREDATDADEHWAHEEVSANALCTTAGFAWKNDRDPERVYIMPADIADLMVFLSARLKRAMSVQAPSGAVHVWQVPQLPMRADDLYIAGETAREALCRYWLACLNSACSS